MSDNHLEEELAKLTKAIERLNDQRFIRMHSDRWMFIWMNFARGLIIGLGSVLGATVLLYFVLQFLGRIDFIPIVGEWAVELAEIISRNGDYRNY